MTMNPKLLLSAVAALASAGAAQAQMLIGYDLSASPTKCWHVDVATGTATALWSTPTVWGLAVDEANGAIYSCNGTTLYRTAYGAPPLTPVSLGIMTDIVGGTAQSLVGLAWANGELYGMKNIANEAIWHIETDPLDPDFLKCTVVLDYVDADYDLGGIEFNTADGMFYATNDDTTPHGSGLFRLDVFGTGTITLVTPYPTLAGTNDCDGLSVGNDKAYFIEDQVSDIDVYDLATNTFGTPLPNPMTGSAVFSAGAWASNLFGPSGPVVYCTAGTSSSGCVASISGTGTPSASASSGFVIDVASVEGQKQGLLFYGISGRAATPWGSGGTSFLCVKAPTQRMGVQSSGGTPAACDGALSEDWLGFMASHPGALGQPISSGQTINAQAWYRDPPAVKTTNLSDGLEFTLVP
jgi:hypothetical protein